MTFQRIAIALLLTLATSYGMADDEANVRPLSEARDWGRIVEREQALELHIDKVPDNRVILIPRLNNRMKAVTLKGSDAEIRFKPLLTEWELTLPNSVTVGSSAVVVFESLEPIHLPVKPEVIAQEESGEFQLPAHKAVTHGKLLRYEPQPHKNTVGYWANADDWFEWHIDVQHPGTFSIEVHQGCGTGQGGSQVQFDVGGRKVEFIIEDTGHFQNFKSRNIGTVQIDKPGKLRVQVRTLKKAKNAVCDIRLTRLIPVR